jgi:hypothetical protein
MMVWVDGWQMQCCGDPFSVGSRVSWTLGDADLDWITTILAEGSRPGVDAAEDHHGGIPEETPVTDGSVVRIAAVHCRFAPGADSRALYPVQDSGVLAEVGSADGWVPDRGDLRFTGYLVQLAD